MICMTKLIKFNKIEMNNFILQTNYYNYEFKFLFGRDDKNIMNKTFWSFDGGFLIFKLKRIWLSIHSVANINECDL